MKILKGELFCSITMGQLSYMGRFLLLLMGNQLCPGTAKEIIQELEELEKGQRNFGDFFMECIQIKENKLNELLQHEGQDFYLSSHRENPQLQSKLVLENLELSVGESIQDLSLEHSEKQNLANECLTVEILFEDKSKYKGQVLNGLPHGEGEEWSAEGDYYKGTFELGQKHGFGVYIFANSQKYEGQFLQNMMWGLGVYHFANGDRYEGQFIRNERSGKGKYVFRENNKEGLLHFEGCYRNDLKEGNGLQQYGDHEMAGIWKCGLYELILDSQSLN